MTYMYNKLKCDELTCYELTWIRIYTTSRSNGAWPGWPAKCDNVRQRGWRGVANWLCRPCEGVFILNNLDAAYANFEK